MNNFIIIDSAKREMRRPTLDLCRCDTCKKVLLSKNAIPDYGYHDGYELKPYTEYLCPHCDTGYIDDFWPSSRSIKEFNGNE